MSDPRCVICLAPAAFRRAFCEPCGAAWDEDVVDGEVTNMEAAEWVAKRARKLAAARLRQVAKTRRPAGLVTKHFNEAADIVERGS